MTPFAELDFDEPELRLLLAEYAAERLTPVEMAYVLPDDATEQMRTMAADIALLTGLPLTVEIGCIVPKATVERFAVVEHEPELLRLHVVDALRGVTLNA